MSQTSTPKRTREITCPDAPKRIKRQLNLTQSELRIRTPVISEEEEESFLENDTVPTMVLPIIVRTSSGMTPLFQDGECSETEHEED